MSQKNAPISSVRRFFGVNFFIFLGSVFERVRTGTWSFGTGDKSARVPNLLTKIGNGDFSQISVHVAKVAYSEPCRHASAMRGDDVRRERSYERFTPRELQALYDSRDWRERMIRHGDAGGLAVQQRLCALARTRRAVLVRDHIPIFCADVSFVHDVTERRWVEDFNVFVEDPVRAARVRLFDDFLLFDLPAPGCQGRSCVTRPHAYFEDRRLDRVARYMKGFWLPAHDAIHVTRLFAAQQEQ